MKPLPKRVWILGWISLFADVASEMVYPIIPVFLNRVIMAPVLDLGAVEGFAEAIVSFMKGWSGWHSDQTGKRVPYIQIGYGLSALGKPIIALANAVGLVLFGRALDRFGKGIRTTSRDALLADSVDKADYGRAYGLHRTMDTTGAFMGGVVLLCLLATLVRTLPDLRLVFLIAIVPGALSVFFTFLLKDVPRDKEPAQKTTAKAKLSEMPMGYWRAVLVTLVFGLANSSDTFLILRANDVFRNSHPTFLGLFSGTTAVEGALIMTTLAYLLYNFTYVLFSYPAGKLSDHVGRWPIFGSGILLYVLVYAGFAYFSSWAVWILFAIYGIYNGLTDGVGKALVADHSPKEARGTALGFFYMGAGAMTLIGNLIAGWLWDAHGPAATFAFGSAVAAVAALMIPLTARMETQAKTPQRS
ncbi:MAG TPA: MFS transporter [Fimbriimonadaceae bacterium]|nr:MFS transporter [Fimbriimonadaceae bacterium]